MKSTRLILTVLALAGVISSFPSPPLYADTIDQAVKKLVQGSNDTNEPVLPPISIFSHGLLDSQNNLLLKAWGGTVGSTGATVFDLSGSTGTFKFPLGDVTLSPPANGGNLGAANTLSAVIKAKLVPFATIANGTTETIEYFESATATSAVTVGVAPTDTDDTTIARIGSSSVKLAWSASSVAGDGVSDTITSDSLEDNRVIGFWFRSSEVLAAGDLTLVLTDNGGARTFNLPAVTSPNVWQWIEINITALTGGTGDAITAVKILLSTAGAAAHGAFDTWIDGMYKWISTAELSCGVDLIDEDGAVASFLTITKANTGTHDMTARVEGTDFIVVHRSGNDKIVPITDMSATSGFALLFYKN